MQTLAAVAIVLTSLGSFLAGVTGVVNLVLGRRIHGKVEEIAANGTKALSSEGDAGDPAH